MRLRRKREKIKEWVNIENVVWVCKYLCINRLTMRFIFGVFETNFLLIQNNGKPRSVLSNIFYNVYRSHLRFNKRQ